MAKSKGVEYAMFQVKLSDVVNGDNTRGDFKEAHISELMQSMKQHGQLQPIGVRSLKNGKYETVFGNRRVAAARKLGWETIDVVISGECGTKEADIKFYLTNATENLQRENPSFTEQGRIFYKLVKMGLDKKEIAARLGITERRVHDIIEAYDRVPAYLRDKVTIDARPGTEKSGLSLANVNAVINATKHNELSPGTRDKLFKYAMRPRINKEQIQQVSQLLSQGIPLKDATRRISSMRVVSVNFTMLESSIDAVEKRTGRKIKQVIYDVVRESKLIPLARLGSAYEHSRRGEKKEKV